MTFWKLTWLYLGKTSNLRRIISRKNRKALCIIIAHIIPFKICSLSQEFVILWTVFCWFWIKGQMLKIKENQLNMKCFSKVKYFYSWKLVFKFSIKIKFCLKSDLPENCNSWYFEIRKYLSRTALDIPVQLTELEVGSAVTALVDA